MQQTAFVAASNVSRVQCKPLEEWFDKFTKGPSVSSSPRPPRDSTHPMEVDREDDRGLSPGFPVDFVCSSCCLSVERYQSPSQNTPPETRRTRPRKRVMSGSVSPLFSIQAVFRR